MKPVHPILLVINLMMAAQVFSQSAGKNEIIVCGSSKVVIIKHVTASSDTMPAVIWEWDAEKLRDKPDGFLPEVFNKIDECKPVNNGEQLLITSSSGGAAVLNRADKKVLFYANVPNAHSIELLPDNVLAIASSVKENGNSIFLYSMAQGNKPLFKDSLYSAHGVVWHRARNSLYAFGHNELRAYKLNKGPSGAYSLQLAEKWITPNKNGHDLQIDEPGNRLIFTDDKKLWQFDLSSKKISEYAALEKTADIKSIQVNPATQQILYVQAEESWWAHRIYLSNPDRFYSFPDMNVYKARWNNVQSVPADLSSAQ